MVHARGSSLPHQNKSRKLKRGTGLQPEPATEIQISTVLTPHHSLAIGNPILTQIPAMFRVENFWSNQLMKTLISFLSHRLVEKLASCRGNWSWSHLLHRIEDHLRYECSSVINKQLFVLFQVLLVLQPPQRAYLNKLGSFLLCSVTWVSHYRIPKITIITHNV